MTARRSGAALLAAAALAAAAGWAVARPDGSDATAAPPVDRAAVAAAAGYRSVTGLDARVALTPRAVRAWVAGRSRLPPLPPGGNFNGIDWAGLGGPVTLADADAILQYNARCQWRRAHADGRSAATAARVIALADGWPALRGLDEAAPGQPDGSVLPCYASHEREVRRAHALGLAPSA